MADFDEDVEQNQERAPRAGSISKKRLDELGQDKDANATIAIYIRDKNKVLQIFDPKYPKDAAVLFSQAISDVFHRGDKFYIIDDDDTTGYKTIFNWIRQCRDTHSDREVPEPTIEDESDPFSPYISLLLAAQKLRIPVLTLHAPLVKKLTSLSRKAIIPLDIVRQIFDSFDPLSTLGLQEVATTSIFEAWFTWKLEEPEYDEYMHELADLRDGIPELDQGLHDAVKKKEAWIAERREKKRREREEAQASVNSGGNVTSDNLYVRQDSNVDDGWGTIPQTGVEMPAWMNEGNGIEKEAREDWNLEWTNQNGGKDNCVDEKVEPNGTTWADEMNEEQDNGQTTQTYALQPAISSVVW